MLEKAKEQVVDIGDDQDDDDDEPIPTNQPSS